MMNDAQRYQGLKPASRKSGLSIYALRKLAKEGKIPVVRFGKIIYVDMERLPEALEKLTDEQ